MNLFNSFTSKCVLAETKKSQSEGFWLAKHTAHKHPHHDEPFPPPSGMVLIDEHTLTPGVSGVGVGQGGL